MSAPLDPDRPMNEKERRDPGRDDSAEQHAERAPGSAPEETPEPDTATGEDA